MRHSVRVAAGALLAGGLFLFVDAVLAAPADGGAPAVRAVAERWADQDGGDDEDELAEARAARRKVQSEILARLQALDEEQADFFVQLELWFAKQTFDAMRDGARAMLDEKGDAITVHLDAFHNQLDELQRALAQLQSGPLPARETYGKEANAAARRIKKPMKTSELQRRGKAVAKEVRALEALADRTAGLEELDLDRKLESIPELVQLVHRVEARIQVLTDGRMGLGPRFTTAHTDAAPLHEDLLKLVQAANGLDVEGLNAKSEELAVFEEWLAEALLHAGQLGRTAPIYKSANHGHLGAQCVESLERLERQFKRLKSKLPRS